MYVYIYKQVALKVMPPTYFHWPTTSEAVGVREVEVETSHQ